MDTPKITHISLCAGYGGIDLGLRRIFGDRLRTVAYSEIETYAVENLLARMEEGNLDAAPIWPDLRTFPWEEFPFPGILSGGFPCQPFSTAGKRGADTDPRHIFPFILDGIRRCKPSLVFLENVEGIISAKLGEGWRDPAGTPVLRHVLRELERVGYKATAGVFSASEVGAPHQRKRVFILGHRKHAGSPRMQDTGGSLAPSHGITERPNPAGELARAGGSQNLRDILASELADHHNERGQEFGASAGGSKDIAAWDTRWPARPGQPQFDWEPPRVV